MRRYAVSFKFSYILLHKKFDVDHVPRGTFIRDKKIPLNDKWYFLNDSLQNERVFIGEISFGSSIQPLLFLAILSLHRQLMG